MVKIVKGNSDIDLSILTGESKPSKIIEGMRVFAGTRNISEKITIKAEAIGKDSRIGRLMQVVEHASERRAPIAELTDRIGAYFVFTVLVLAGLTFFYWLGLGLEHAINNSLALLVVTCPCALGLAAPIALSVSVARASEKGILVLGTDAIERLARTDKIYFDKTGTITSGRATLSKLFVRSDKDIFTPVNDSSPVNKELVSASISLEKEINHPTAFAIRDYFLEHYDLETLPKINLKLRNTYLGTVLMVLTLLGTRGKSVPGIAL